MPFFILLLFMARMAFAASDCQVLLLPHFGGPAPPKEMRRTLAADWDVAIELARGEKTPELPGELNSRAVKMYQTAANIFLEKDVAFKFEYAREGYPRVRLKCGAKAPLSRLVCLLEKIMPGWKIYFDPRILLHNEGNAMVSPSDESFYLSTDTILDPRIDPFIFHELQHYWTLQDSLDPEAHNPLLGSTIAPPGKVISPRGYVLDGYGNYQAHDEPEAYLITLYRELKDLERFSKRNDAERIARALRRIGSDAGLGRATAARNILVANLQIKYWKGENVVYNTQNGIYRGSVTYHNDAGVAVTTSIRMPQLNGENGKVLWPVGLLRSAMLSRLEALQRVSEHLKDFFTAVETYDLPNRPPEERERVRAALFQFVLGQLRLRRRSWSDLPSTNPIVRWFLKAQGLRE